MHPKANTGRNSRNKSMLKSLFIRNYALIDTLHIQFEKGFSVITGETGAGKSIILGAIGLLLGQRADSKAAKDKTAKCVIEAVFDIKSYDIEDFFNRNDLETDGSECIIRREISATGKSRAFINDTPVQVTQLKELGEMLIDVHSQHQNLLLNKEDFQLKVLDILAGDKAELTKYHGLYSTYRQAGKRLEEAVKAAETALAEEDYLRFQLEQLDELAPQPGEQEELEQEAETLSHAEEIKQALFDAERLMDNEQGVLDALKESTHLLEHINKVYPEADELAERMNSCYIELKDLSDEIAARAERIEFNPERLNFINERLNSLYELEQKHRVDTPEALIELAEDFREKLNAIAHGEEHIQELKAEYHKAEKAMKAQADVLTSLRKEAAAHAERQMEERLVPLGIPNIRFKVELSPRDTPDENGADRIAFLFSANKNGTLQPISQVASGGEIARVMLSLKAMISGAVKLPTIIFDEIDTGVSGNIAERMARIMQEMGAPGRQVISITHLPQIAAAGSIHYKVYKEDDMHGTTSHIIRLDDTQRVEEIAHMLSGASLTDAAVNNAKELLNHSKYTRK